MDIACSWGGDIYRTTCSDLKLRRVDGDGDIARPVNVDVVGCERGIGRNCDVVGISNIEIGGSHRAGGHVPRDRQVIGLQVNDDVTAVRAGAQQVQIGRYRDVEWVARAGHVCGEIAVFPARGVGRGGGRPEKTATGDVD